MTGPWDLTEARLRDNIIRDALGLPVPEGDALIAFEVLLDLLEEASSADGIESSITDVGDLSGCISTLDKLRTSAVDAERDAEAAKEEAEAAKEEAEKEHEKALEEKDADHAEEIADLHAQYEKANADLRERVAEEKKRAAEAEAKVAALLASEPWKVLGELLSAASNFDSAVIGFTDHAAVPRIRRDFRAARDRALEVLQGKPAEKPAEEERIPLRSERRKKK